MWNLPSGDYAAGCARNMLDWIGQAVGEGLAAGHDTLFTAKNGSEWDLRYHAPAEFKQYMAEESHFVQPEADGEIDPRVKGWMERRPRPLHAQKTSVTALLRGAVLLADTEETPESKRKALHLDTLPQELPDFMMEKHLSAADRGTAAHKALGALDLHTLKQTAGKARIENIKEQLTRMQTCGQLSTEEAEVVDIADILGEAFQICPEIDLDVVGIVQQRLKGILAGVVEAMLGCFAEQDIPHGQVLHALVLFQNRILGFRQDAVKAAEYGHRQNHFAVLMGFVDSGQFIRNRPYQGGFFVHICT